MVVVVLTGPSQLESSWLMVSPATQLSQRPVLKHKALVLTASQLVVTSLVAKRRSVEQPIGTHAL